MLIRCAHCFTPFTLTPETIQLALDQIEDNGWKHYNSYCPRCGKPNVVGKDQLMRFAPDWAAENAPKPVTTPPAPAPRPAASAPSRPAPTPAKASAKPKAAAKPKASAGKKKAKPKKAAPSKKKPAAKKAAKPKAKSSAKKKKKK